MGTRLLTPRMTGLLERIRRAGPRRSSRLRLAGVAVELELARGVTHDFIKMGRALDEARLAQAHAGGALRRAFEP